MTPVVNGLAEELAEVVDFRSLNAAFGEGEKAFNSYGLPGHPSYIILNPEGDVLWRGFGPQTQEALNDALTEAITSADPALENEIADAGEPVDPPTVSVPPLGEPVGGSEAQPLPTLNPDTVARGEQVYQQYCSACHGANLEGQPNWQSPLPDGSLPAPPHDSSGHTWHHSDDLLLNIIAEGSNPAFGGTMQGFAELLDGADMMAVLEFIKSHWDLETREIQWRITSSNTQ
jgi:mono/diheme cytochrome c family protein